MFSFIIVTTAWLSITDVNPIDSDLSLGGTQSRSVYVRAMSPYAYASKADEDRECVSHLLPPLIECDSSGWLIWYPYAAIPSLKDPSLSMRRLWFFKCRMISDFVSSGISFLPRIWLHFAGSGCVGDVFRSDMGDVIVNTSWAPSISTGMPLDVWHAKPCFRNFVCLWCVMAFSV